jgi:hypothetical protein
MLVEVGLEDDGAPFLITLVTDVTLGFWALVIGVVTVLLPRDGWAFEMILLDVLLGVGETEVFTVTRGYCTILIGCLGGDTTLIGAVTTGTGLTVLWTTVVVGWNW